MSSNVSTSFAKRIRPHFREFDIEEMRNAPTAGFNVVSIEDVRPRAETIYQKLNAASGGVPCDEPRPAEWIALFRRRIYEDKKGEPTISVNSIIESGFAQATSSCISCHALSAADTTPSSFPLGLTPGGNGPNGCALKRNGIEMSAAFENDEEDVIKMDFVWSLRNAD